MSEFREYAENLEKNLEKVGMIRKTAEGTIVGIDLALQGDKSRSICIVRGYGATWSVILNCLKNSGEEDDLDLVDYITSQLPKTMNNQETLEVFISDSKKLAHFLNFMKSEEMTDQYRFLIDKFKPGKNMIDSNEESTLEDTANGKFM